MYEIYGFLPHSEGCGKVITARVRSTTRRYCFHRCLSVNNCGGGYPVQVWMVGGNPGQGWMGGATPSQVWGGTPAKSGWWGVPHPRSGWWGVPPTMTGWGTSPHHDWMGYPPKQHSEHLLCGGRYASCVHVGGLSCVFTLFVCPSWRWVPTSLAPGPSWGTPVTGPRSLLGYPVTCSF